MKRKAKINRKTKETNISVAVNLDGKGKYKINIDYKKKRGILLRPKTWCKIKFKTKKCILMVFCDREYEFSDYIENYKDFLKLI